MLKGTNKHGATFRKRQRLFLDTQLVKWLTLSWYLAVMLPGCTGYKVPPLCFRRCHQ